MKDHVTPSEFRTPTFSNGHLFALSAGIVESFSDEERRIISKKELEIVAYRIKDGFTEIQGYNKADVLEELTRLFDGSIRG